MTISPLANYRVLTNNHGERDGAAIDTITIHCLVGQATAKEIGVYFRDTKDEVSCNYGIGKDGDIVCCVPEELRSWCSSNRANDARAITIEVASDKTEPYAVTEAAYNSLISLLVDICKRNGIDALRWLNNPRYIGRPELQNMTVHRWFANKSCPGEYLFSRMGEIAATVNSRLAETGKKWYRVQVGAFRVKENAERFRDNLKEIGIDCFIVEGE